MKSLLFTIAFLLSISAYSQNYLGKFKSQVYAAKGMDYTMKDGTMIYEKKVNGDTQMEMFYLNEGEVVYGYALAGTFAKSVLFGIMHENKEIYNEIEKPQNCFVSMD